MNIDHNTATLRISEATSLAEILAQVGDVAEDQLPHIRTVAGVIAEKLQEAQAAMVAR